MVEAILNCMARIEHRGLQTIEPTQAPRAELLVVAHRAVVGGLGLGPIGLRVEAFRHAWTCTQNHAR
eukprot:11458337-Alexandrium_andersonii.AAC.1